MICKDKILKICTDKRSNYLVHCPIRSTSGKFPDYFMVSDHFEISRFSTFIYENAGDCQVDSVNILSKDMVKLLRTTTRPKVHRITIGFDRIVEFDTLHAMIDYENGLFEIYREGYEASTRLDSLAD